MIPSGEVVSAGSGNGVGVVDLGAGVCHGGGGQMKNSIQNGGDGNGASNLKKGPWTAEEDAVLVEHVRKHGEGNWNAVQKHSGLARCGKSCRLRWANHLRPNLRKGAFSPDEERLIVELHAKFGNKWARMASLLPGRTDNEIKNYWNTRVKRHQRKGLPLYPPDVQPQHPPSHHFLHHQYHHSSSQSLSASASATAPTSSFTFPTQFPNSSTPIGTPSSATPPPLSPATTSTSFPMLPLFDYSQPHNHHHNSSSHSAPTTPTSSFSFPSQQLHSPNNRKPSTPPRLSPLSSPSTNTNPNFQTLPLFDFNASRTPPILQSPVRFKCFSSNPEISNHQSNIHNKTHFTSQSSHQMASCNFTSFLNNSDFHSEMQEEDQKMRSLLASVTQPELPSSQFLSNHRNLGIGVGAASKLGRKMSKRKYGDSLNDKLNGKLGFALMEELLQECGQNNPTDHNSLLLQDQKSKIFVSQGFSTHWDQHPHSHALSSEVEQKGEVGGQVSTMLGAQELSKVLNTYPTVQQAELYSESADISNGQSSVVTDENIEFEMQQMASLFPPAEHDRGLGSCSWDNLPGIC